MMKKSLIRMSAFVLLGGLAAGCENGGVQPMQVQSSPQELKVSTEPVTLSILIAVPGLTDADFTTLIAEPLKKKYPYITLEPSRPGAGQSLVDLITAGTIPDLMYGHLGNLSNYTQELKVPADLTPLMKKFNVDESRFDPLVMETIKGLGNKGQINSLPFTQNTFALWYNKGIFDRFGAPYPKDGMTWEDAIALARLVTRSEGGIQYRGLDIYNNNTIRTIETQLSLNVIDPKTEKAFVSEKWKDVFQLAMTIYDIPGNKPASLSPNNVVPAFLKERTLAMAPTFTNAMLSQLSEADSTGLDWDVAQTPSYKEVPNTSFEFDVHQLFISEASKYKEQAFQVIQFATSDEVQLTANKQGKYSALNNQEIRRQYAADIPYVKGKNLQGIFKSKSAKLPAYSKYSPFVNQAIDQAFRDVFSGKTTDINSALRETEEAANLKIEQEKMK
jgi:multiple sugar transport system substrate-binding protein